MRVARCGLIVLALLLSGCTNLFFHPSPVEVLHPDRLNLRFEDVQIETPDQVKLHGWYLPATGGAKGTILHLHGNAENISTFIAATWWLPARGYNVLLLDYRGYGRSEGTPQVHGLHRDAEAAIKYLMERGGGVDSERLILLGQSLGGSIAIYVAAHSAYRAHIRAVVTEGAFASYRRIAKEKMQMLWLTRYLRWPLSYLFNDDYAAVKAVAAVAPIPLLLLHGSADEVIPPSHGELLYQSANEPRELWMLENGGHANALTKPENRDRLVEWLDRNIGL